MKQRGIASVIVGAATALGAAACHAEVVAEWQFNPEKDSQGGSVVLLDVAKAGASKESALMAESKLLAGATGIGEAWKPFLGKGYIEVSQGPGPNHAEKHGLVTRSTDGAGNGSYESYMGFPGLGSGQQGGTVYMVFQPTTDWRNNVRRGLFGSGQWIGQPLSTWSISLWARNGTLMLMGGRGEANAVDLNGDGDMADYVYAEAKVSQTWDPTKWYFVGASWQEGAAPVLFVREMAKDGPAASPAGVAGKASEAKGNIVAKFPQGTGESNSEPIAIGAQWVNHGNGQTRDGGDARIAYARVENTYTSSTGKMDEVFKSLAAP